MFGPIRHLILAAALFLPLAFFVWFSFASLLVDPAAFLSKWVLTSWLPDVFIGLERERYYFDWVTTLPVDAATQAAAGGKKIGVVMTINPMIYGYGLPVVAGLAMASPLSILERSKQILIAFAVITLVQANGVIWEAMSKLALNSGPTGMAAFLQTGLTPNLVAFLYQLGYLILPPLVPVILWAMMNQTFIQKLISVDRFEDLEEQSEDENKPLTHLADATERSAEVAKPASEDSNSGKNS